MYFENDKRKLFSFGTFGELHCYDRRRKIIEFNIVGNPAVIDEEDYNESFVEDEFYNAVVSAMNEVGLYRKNAFEGSC